MSDLMVRLLTIFEWLFNLLDEAFCENRNLAGNRIACSLDIFDGTGKAAYRNDNRLEAYRHRCSGQRV
jgi:hypothetical protein